MAEENINVKEMGAIAKVLESLPSEIRDCRVNVQVDNQAVLYTWMGRSSKSMALIRIAQDIFQLITRRNILLELKYVPSKCNPADWFSRTYSKGEAMLSEKCWELVQRSFGEENGHNLDLMALDSNVQKDLEGKPLRHNTPYPTPRSAGINVFSQDLSRCDGIKVNAYVFPPFALIPPTTTMVVPCPSPLPSWWPRLQAMSSRRILLATAGSKEAILCPSKQGWKASVSPYDLWAFRIDNL